MWAERLLFWGLALTGTGSAGRESSKLGKREHGRDDRQVMNHETSGSILVRRVHFRLAALQLTIPPTGSVPLSTHDLGLDSSVTAMQVQYILGPKGKIWRSLQLGQTGQSLTSSTAGRPVANILDTLTLR